MQSNSREERVAGKEEKFEAQSYLKMTLNSNL